MQREKKEKVLFRYLKLLIYHKKLLVISFFLIIVNSILAILLPTITMYIIDSALPQKNVNQLIYLSIIFFVIVVSQCLCKFILDYTCNILGKKIVFTLKDKLLNHIMSLDGKYYSNMNVGELLTTIDSDIYSIEQISSNVFFVMLCDIITSIIMLIFLMKLQINLVGIIIFIQIFLLVFQIISCKKVIIRKAHYRDAIGNLSNTEEEILSNIKNITLLNAKEYFLKKFRRKNLKVYETGIKINITTSMNSNITSLLNGITTVVILGYGGYKIINNNMEIGELIAFNMYAQRIFVPIIRQTQSNLMIQQVIISLNKIFTILDKPLNIKSYNFTEQNKRENLIGKIMFNNISFSYNSDELILEKFNLTVSPLDSIAIVGESGTGKTTITNLLFNICQTNYGEILIDNKNIEEYDVNYLRKNISILSQDSFIFKDTVYNNLTLGNKHIRLEEVECICKKTCIHDFIMSLPDKYYTVIGYKGDTLSGGQKQRLCIARAFLKKSPILILDEMTSALDKDLEKKIMVNLVSELNKKTCILITHRLSLLKYVDNVFVLEKGKLNDYQINT